MGTKGTTLVNTKTLQQQPRQQQQASKAKEKLMNLIGPPGF